MVDPARPDDEIVEAQQEFTAWFEEAKQEHRRVFETPEQIAAALRLLLDDDDQKALQDKAEQLGFIKPDETMDAIIDEVARRLAQSGKFKKNMLTLIKRTMEAHTQDPPTIA